MRQSPLFQLLQCFFPPEHLKQGPLLKFYWQTFVAKVVIMSFFSKFQIYFALNKIDVLFSSLLLDNEQAMAHSNPDNTDLNLYKVNGATRKARILLAASGSVGAIKWILKMHFTSLI